MNRKRKFNRFLLFLFVNLMILGAFTFSGCNETQEEEPDAFYLYYKNPKQRALLPVPYEIDSEKELNIRISETIRQLSVSDLQGKYATVFSSGIQVKEFDVKGENLLIQFDDDFRSLADSQQLLLRASLTKTMTQFAEISTVEIQVNYQPLMQSDGAYIGPQKGTDFIDLFGNYVSEYNCFEAVLYFADSTGEKLVSEVRKVYYDHRTPLEEAVLRAVLEGPMGNGYPTFQKKTDYISCSTQKGVCYINFDRSLLEDSTLKNPEIMITSIVNSLTEIDGISSVSFSVSGSSNVIFRDTVDFTNMFYRNLDFVRIESTDEEKEKTIE